MGGFRLAIETMLPFPPSCSGLGAEPHPGLKAQVHCKHMTWFSGSSPPLLAFVPSFPRLLPFAVIYMVLDGQSFLATFQVCFSSGSAAFAAYPQRRPWVQDFVM